MNKYEAEALQNAYAFAEEAEERPLIQNQLYPFTHLKPTISQNY